MMSLPSLVSPITRPRANFPPSVWGDFFLQYASEPMEVNDKMEQEHRILKEEVKKLFGTTMNHSISEKLKFIDSVQRLGVSYHFEHEIDEALEQIHKSAIKNNVVIVDVDDLYSLALLFRLLRQQGYQISSDVFHKFKNEEGNFIESIGNNVLGLLSMYEAAELRVEGDKILDEAHDFTYNHLNSLSNKSLSPSLTAQINHSLNISLHKRLPGFKARYQVSVLEEDPTHIKNLLTFAKLDFNRLQKMHQKEIGSTNKWWKKSNLGTRVPYARERFVEAYMWSLAVSYVPEDSPQRRIAAKFVTFLSLLDDTYDAYATLQELYLFTEAIQRWDISIIESLLPCMKVVFETVVELCDEIEMMTTQSGKSSFVVPSVKKTICDITQAYLLEAKWCEEGYIPTYDEYKINGILTSTFTVQITSFIALGDFATKDVFDWISSNPNIIKAASVIGRVMDDMASHKFEQKRVHVASAVECCIKQHGISQEEAYELMNKDVKQCWKIINEEYLMKPNYIPKYVLDCVANLARISELVYQNREDRYTDGKLMKDYVFSMLVDPVCINLQQQHEQLSPI